jgi:hypothetical protein
LGRFLAPFRLVLASPFLRYGEFGDYIAPPARRSASAYASGQDESTSRLTENWHSGNLGPVWLHSLQASTGPTTQIAGNGWRVPCKFLAGSASIPALPRHLLRPPIELDSPIGLWPCRPLVRRAKGKVSQASEKQEVGQPAESKTRAGLRACASARTRFRGTGRFRADTRCETPAWPNSPSLCLRGAAGALKIPPSTGFRSQTSLGRRTRRRRAGRMSLDFTTPRLPPRQVSCPQTTADDPARE